MATIGRLGRLHILATRTIADVFATHGLQIGEFDVLAALRRSGAPFVMKPTDLAPRGHALPSWDHQPDRSAGGGRMDRTA